MSIAKWGRSFEPSGEIRIIVNFKDNSGSWDMLLISPVYGILFDGVSKLPHRPNLPSTIVAYCYSLPLFYNVLRNDLMNLSHYGRNVTFFEQSIVLRSLSVLRTFGFASLCMHNSTIRYASWAKHSLWLNDVYTCGRLNSLLPLTSLPAKGSVLTQMPKAYAVSATVARVKTDVLFVEHHISTIGR